MSINSFTQPPPPTTKTNHVSAGSATSTLVTNSTGSTTTSTVVVPNTTTTAPNSDFLNSSQTEKSWLNSSYNERNIGFNNSQLNSSLNLPPELRYQSLADLVSKIIQEEDGLMASGNAAALNNYAAARSVLANHPNR